MKWKLWSEMGKIVFLTSITTLQMRALPIVYMTAQVVFLYGNSISSEISMISPHPHTLWQPVFATWRSGRTRSRDIRHRGRWEPAPCSGQLGESCSSRMPTNWQDSGIRLRGGVLQVVYSSKLGRFLTKKLVWMRVPLECVHFYM
jgi:hypothetical protein